MITKIKIIFCLLLVCCCQIKVAAQTYTVNFNIDDFDLQFENHGLLKIIPNNSDYFFMVSVEDTLQPALPYKTFRILIPRDHFISDFSITNTVIKKGIENNVTIAPCPKGYIGGAKIDTNFVFPKYLQIIYPEDLVSYDYVGHFKGYSMARFIISPFIFDAENNILSFVNEITIIINTKENEKPENLSSVRTDARNNVQNMVINPDEMDELYPVPESTPNRDTTVEYLVITSKDLKKSFDPLIEWKIRKGIRAKTVTLDEIYANCPAHWTPQLKIKNYLQTYYC